MLSGVGAKPKLEGAGSGVGAEEGADVEVGGGIGVRVQQQDFTSHAKHFCEAAAAKSAEKVAHNSFGVIGVPPWIRFGDLEPLLNEK